MSNATPTWLDQLLNKTIENSGTVLPQRPNLNIIGVPVQDNPTNNSTDVFMLGAASTWVSKNAAYTLGAAESVFVDCSGGALTIKLPATPTISGEVHTITNDIGDASINNITVDGNGHNVEDPNTPGTFSATVLIKVKSASVDFRWTGAHWKLT